MHSGFGRLHIKLAGTLVKQVRDKAGLHQILAELSQTAACELAVKENSCLLLLLCCISTTSTTRCCHVLTPCSSKLEVAVNTFKKKQEERTDKVMTCNKVTFFGSGLALPHSLTCMCQRDHRNKRKKLLRACYRKFMM